MSPHAPEEEVRDEASGFAAYLSFYREEMLGLPTAEGETEPRWQVPDDVSAEVLVERLRELGARVTEILAAHDLDEVPTHGPRWDNTDGIPPLRWICFHVLEEYARHAGHLDIAVELAGNPDSSVVASR